MLKKFHNDDHTQTVREMLYVSNVKSKVSKHLISGLLYGEVL